MAKKSDKGVVMAPKMKGGAASGVGRLQKIKGIKKSGKK